MATVYLQLIKGDQRPIYVTSSANTRGEVLQVAVSPAPEVSLYVRSNYFKPVTMAEDFPVDATGYSSDPAEEVQVWYFLDTTALEAGRYLLVFDYDVLAEDGMTRDEIVPIEIEITDPSEL